MHSTLTAAPLPASRLTEGPHTADDQTTHRPPARHTNNRRTHTWHHAHAPTHVLRPEVSASPPALPGCQLARPPEHPQRTPLTVTSASHSAGAIGSRHPACTTKHIAAGALVKTYSSHSNIFQQGHWSTNILSNSPWISTSHMYEGCWHAQTGLQCHRMRSVQCDWRGSPSLSCLRSCCVSSLRELHHAVVMPCTSPAASHRPPHATLQAPLNPTPTKTHMPSAPG